jgi:ubiquinone/menaquinone biosynthesis C-methylase UbiE
MGDRFARTADRLAQLQDARADELAERVRALIGRVGRALDVGAGAGALAFALAPLADEVVAVDLEPALLAEARVRAPANVVLVEGDATELPFEDGSFDLAGTLRTLHHVERPELVVAELVRVTRRGGTVLVVDQLAPADVDAADQLNRFERARDASTGRVLTDAELRALFTANALELRTFAVDREPRELDPYLDLAGCEGDARERARALAPQPYVAELGWYVLTKPS